MASICDCRLFAIMQISAPGGQEISRFHAPDAARNWTCRSLPCHSSTAVLNSGLTATGEPTASRRYEQDADVILFIYRDEVYNPESNEKGIAEILIRKQRNGPIGMVKLAFLGKYTRFENLAFDQYGEQFE